MPATLDLSPEQKTAHDAILAFVKDKKSQLRIGGFAGTGKTYLVAHTLKAIREANKKKTIALACFTGKAAFVLRDKLNAAEALKDEYCGTIHGLMYEPVVVDGVIKRWRRRTSIDADLLIIDEASMVSEQIYLDLKKYKVPMLFIGDHGQLPPIGGQLSLMDKPDVTLTQIQRQAADNPIIMLSAQIRAEGRMPETNQVFTTDGDGWCQIRAGLQNLIDMTKDPGQVMFLCGYNRTRTWLNRAIRERLGFKEPKPMQGEKLICLKNNRDAGIWNGMGGLLKKVDWFDGLYAWAKVQMEDGTDFEGNIVKAQFGAESTLRELEGCDPRELRELFDFGYALTVHKAQGSESTRVVLIDERFSSMTDDDYKRWLYTACTRSRKHLTVVLRSK